MSQLGHTSSTTAALSNNPALDKAQHSAANMGKKQTILILKYQMNMITLQ